MDNKGKLIIVTGPSAAGKSSVVRKVLDTYQNYKEVIDTTTRSCRIDEIPGDTYFFVSKEEFEEGIANGEFISYTSVLGHYYGTSKTVVFSQIEKGMNVILQLPFENAQRVKEQFLNTIIVYILPPETNYMIRDLEKREQNDERVWDRLSVYEKESLVALNADILLVNHDVEKTADSLVKFVEESELAKEVYNQNVDKVKKMQNDIKKYMDNIPRVLLIHAEEPVRMERFIEKMKETGIGTSGKNSNLNSEGYSDDKLARMISEEKNIIFFISKKIVTDECMTKRLLFAWHYAKEREKRIVIICEWESVLSYNKQLQFEFEKTQIIYPEGGLHSEQDYIDVVGQICEVVKREENRELLYDKISSLIKVKYVPGIVSNVSKLIIDLCDEVANSKKQSSRIGIYKEIWRFVEVLNNNGEQGYGEVWRKCAHQRISTIKRFSELLNHSDFNGNNAFLIAFSIRALFFNLQIMEDCIDTITNGDVHSSQCRNDYIEKQHILIKRLDTQIKIEKLSKENNGVYNRDEITLILESNQRYRITNYQDFNEKEKKKNSISEKEDIRLASIAEQMAQTNQLFSLITENSRTDELLQCLKTSYERLRKYSEIIDAKPICAECVEHIAEINQRLDSREQMQNKNILVESAFKALLGFKVPDSEMFDVFISYKHEDLDIARNLYLYLKQNLLYPFFDSYTLPELSNSEYEEAIMDALEKSKHFVVVISKLEYLESFWVALEMKTFQHELNEGRKKDANFMMIVSDEVADQIFVTNKKCLHIRYRSCEIIRISEYKNCIIQYLSSLN